MVVLPINKAISGFNVLRPQHIMYIMYYASSCLFQMRMPIFYKLCSKSTQQVSKMNSSFVTNDVQNNLALGIFINYVKILETQKSLHTLEPLSFLLEKNDNISDRQCPTGTRTRPATRYFLRYPTRPDSVLKIIG